MPKDRATTPYRLDEQIGFVLRRAYQRHAAIFAGDMVGGLTPMQFAALARLGEMGACSQNHLGRLTAMDAATIKGVVDRLRARGLLATQPDPDDRRRALVDLTDPGRALLAEAREAGRTVTARTLEPLDAEERAQLLDLLRRIVD